jgi:hypothetical protein
LASISSLSTEYVKVQVTFTVAGTDTDPTGDTVQMAFKAPGTDPAGGDWVTGSWETDSTVASKPIRYARALVGPAGKVLAKGNYTVWVKVTDTPEVPAMQAPGLLQVV